MTATPPPGYRPRRRSFAFIGAVVLLNNLSILQGTGAESHQAPPDLLVKVALWGAVIGWIAGIERLRWADLGIHRHGCWDSARWGLLAGSGMAIPGVVFLAFPIVLPEPIRLIAFPGLDRASLAIGLLMIPLVNTAAIFEEVLFRGLIQQQGIRWWGPVKGIGFSVALFVLWHIVVVFHGLQLTNLTSAALPWPILYVASALPLAVAGVVFSLLRYRTGNLAGPTVAHWLVNTCLQGFVLCSSTNAVVGG